MVDRARWPLVGEAPPRAAAAVAAGLAAAGVILDHLVDDVLEAQPLFVYGAIAAFGVAIALTLLTGSTRPAPWPRATAATVIGAVCAVVAAVVNEGSIILLVLTLAAAGVAGAISAGRLTAQDASTT